MISILIPFYNGIDFIEETIKSVKTQTFKDYEVLIGVNGHQNYQFIEEKLKQFIGTDSRFVIKNYPVDSDVKNKKSHTLNKMLLDIHFDIVCLLDADDVWFPEKLNKQYQIFSSNIYDIVGTMGCLIDANGKQFKNQNTFIFFDGMTVIDIPHGNLDNFDFKRLNPIINSSCMIRKNLCHWSEDSTVEDYELWFRMWSLKKKFFNLSEILVKHRLYPESFFNNRNNEESKRLKETF